jgi:hypothetical protein
MAGLYGVFRRPHAHTTLQTPWHEADAVLAMVNYALKWIDDYSARLKSSK